MRCGGEPCIRGIDIAEGGVHGATVRASDGGVVTIAGDLNDGYGNYVVIDHGNGYKTLYAHGSAIYVTQGQYVSKGQPILAVGNSGEIHTAPTSILRSLKTERKSIH